MDEDCLFVAGMLFDGFTDGVEDFTIDGTTVSVHCNTESGEEFQAQSGQCVWPASSMLCFYLRGELERSKPRTVVELGCGVGVPGIFVAKQFPDTRVLLTDASPPLLETTKKNLTVNGVSERATTAVVVWGDDGLSQLDSALTANAYGAVDVVIGSDVFHSGGSLTAVPFLRTVAHCCRVWRCPCAIVVSSFRSPDTTATVESACAAMGLRRIVIADGLCDEDPDRLPHHRCLVEHFVPADTPVT